MQFLSTRPVSPKMKVRRVWNLEIFWWHHSILPINHQCGYLENANLFTPPESQEPFIMALRLEITILGKEGEAPGAPACSGKPTPSFSGAPPTLQGFFHFLNYTIQSASGKRLLHTGPSTLCTTVTLTSHLLSIPHPTCLSKWLKITLQIMGQMSIPQGIFWWPGLIYLWSYPLQRWDYLQLCIYLCHYLLGV